MGLFRISHTRLFIFKWPQHFNGLVWVFSLMYKIYLTAFLCSTAIVFSGCSDTTEAKANNAAVEQKVPKQPEKLAPEDDKNLTGTPVLGFKLRDSTFDSVKKRLTDYQVDANNVSYAGGPLLENDGSGFNIDGLVGTQFGFDENEKLVYVWMVLNENNHMSHETYKKIVSYIKKNNYKIVREKAPYVGDRETEFVTPNNDTILVRSPHMGGFKVQVEYLIHEFSQQRSQSQAAQKQQKNTAESANF